MSTLLQAGFEGQTNTTVPTAANSDDFGDSAMGNPVIGSGGAITYDTAHPMHGTKDLKIVSASGAATYVPYSLAANNATINIRFYFYYTGAPTTAEMAIAAIVNTGGTEVFKIILNTAGTVRLRDNASASPTGATGMTALTASTLYRFEMQVKHGAGTTDGSIDFAYYVGDGTTAVSGGTFAATNVNAGTTDFTKAYFGRPDAGTAGTYTAYYDDIAINDGLTLHTFIGPYSTAVPVTNAGPDQVVSSGDTVQLAGSGTNTPTSYAWTPPGGITLSSNTAQNPTFVAPTVSTTTNYTISLVANNANGAGSTDTVVIQVQPAPPGVSAGADQSVNSGSTVTLRGVGTNSPSSYAWTQTAGPTVTLSDPTIAQPTFAAPTVSTPTVLSFSVTATNGQGTSSPDTVDITVNPVGAGKLNTFETQSNGTAVSPSNSAVSGDAFSTVVNGTGSAQTYDTTHPTAGTIGIKMVGASGTNCYSRMELPNSNNSANLAFEFYFDGTLPTAETPLGYLTAAGATRAYIAMTTTGGIRLRDAASGSLSAVLFTLVSGHSYRFELQGIVGADTASGIVNFAMYDLTAPTTTLFTPFRSTTANLGTAALTAVFIGRAGAGTGATTFWYDNVQCSSGLTDGTYLGPPGSGVPVTNAGPDQSGVDAGTTVTMSATASHEPTSWAWVQTGGPTVQLSANNVPTVTFIAPSDIAGTSVTFTCQASNASGAGTVDSITILIEEQDQWTLHLDNTWHGTRNFVIS